MRRAGFEPANPYGRGWLIGVHSNTDLESSAFDLAWLPPPKFENGQLKFKRYPFLLPSVTHFLAKLPAFCLSWWCGKSNMDFSMKKFISQLCSLTSLASYIGDFLIWMIQVWRKLKSLRNPLSNINRLIKCCSREVVRYG